MPLILLSIAAGASLGALLRFGLAEAFNHLWPNLPAGTLAANLLGAFLMGLALASFLALPNLPIAWRLFLTTGFLGGLTTFSTFSAEAFLLLQRGEVEAVAIHVIAHVVGSLAATAVGFLTARALWRPAVPG
ncbi:fluoride efflux transporter CrcB [Xanthomonas sp. NCPPB 2632]|uniref:fluoride efflux transporter CrcB n=1 Tax=Xanthomonas sp. NCPPB 2632 TaxID=3240912 RepID=UPI003516D1EA